MYQPPENTGTNLEKHSNDIALLLLGRNVTFTEFIQPIGIPLAQNNSLRGSSVVHSLTIAGWGRTNKESRATSTVKIKALVHSWSMDSCKKLYAEVRPGQMCAGGGASKKSSCFGDSGGPVMNDDQLVGIISLGASKCGSDRTPMVVTRVENFLKWHAEHMKM
ncbi:CLIP domain-containing serine protease 2-like [Drosophila eugracilis]|uniref:CLIP domain-containing serine protease 2-like n=1 Tax=Drosophila eugracilis TaxID=29029 RepID=UPI0007E78B72|nr:CLIP domain-containing serine protease 2-like [Drosophila eugracilis]